MEGEDPHDDEEKKLTHTPIEHDVPDAVGEHWEEMSSQVPLCENKAYY